MLLKAVLYARVSSDRQEKEGFSIPAQKKLLKEYAKNNNISIVAEFVEPETAKKAGRTKFNEMLKYLRKHPQVRIMLVEKTDRIYRNLKDYVTLDEFKDLEVHLVKEHEIISDKSSSHEKFVHGLKVLMAKNYIDNLSEEIRKGLQEKCAQGYYPSSLPIGYVNKPNATGKKEIYVCRKRKERRRDQGDPGAAQDGIQYLYYGGYLKLSEKRRKDHSCSSSAWNSAPY